MLASLDAAAIAALERDVVDRWTRWSDAQGMKCAQGMSVAKAIK
jgi:hypothetical protein